MITIFIVNTASNIPIFPLRLNAALQIGTKITWYRMHMVKQMCIKHDMDACQLPTPCPELVLGSKGIEAAQTSRDIVKQIQEADGQDLN